MTREPGRLIFTDERQPSTAATASNGGSAPVAAKGEPRALSFPAEVPRPEKTVAREPAPLNFPKVTAAPAARVPAPTPTSARVEVRTVSFPPAPAVQRQPAPAALAAPRGPGALDLSRFPAPKPAAKVAGTPVFAQTKHPLHATVVAKAQSLGEALLTAENLPKLERHVAELLPLRLQVLENYGALMLEQGREHAEHTARLSQRYLQLRAGDILQKALEVSMPATSMRQRLNKMFDEDRNVWIQRLRVLRQSLAVSLQELRDAQPEAYADAERLALLMLALRSALEVCGTPQDNSLEFVLNQRLDTLRMAVTQANMVPAQLRANEQSASLQLVECDRLLHVTFSANALAQGATPRPIR